MQPAGKHHIKLHDFKKKKKKKEKEKNIHFTWVYSMKD